MPTQGKREASGIGYGGATSTFTFTTSTTSEDSTMTETSMSNTMTESMTVGWEFNNMTVEQSHTEGLTTATTNTMSQSTSESVEITCSSSKYADAWGVGLWQWVGTSPDGKVMVKTGLR